MLQKSVRRMTSRQWYTSIKHQHPLQFPARAPCAGAPTGIPDPNNTLVHGGANSEVGATRRLQQATHKLSRT